jgi:hypothetical protein
MGNEPLNSPYLISGIGYISGAKTLEQARAWVAKDRLGGAIIYRRIDIGDEDWQDWGEPGMEAYDAPFAKRPTDAR